MGVGTLVGPALAASALFACGDNGGGRGDGPRADGAIGSVDARRDSDASFDASSRGPITVTVHGGWTGTCQNFYGGHDPCVGDHVVFTGPAGNVIADEVTDSMGRVTAMIEPGSALTVVHVPEVGQPQLLTLFDLQIGDDVFVGEHAFPPAGSFAMQGMYSEPPGDTYDTYAYGACASGTPLGTLALSVRENCMTRPFDIAVIGYESVGPTYYYAAAYDVAPASGGTVTLGPWQEYPAFVARVHGVPPTTEVSVDRLKAIQHGTWNGAEVGIRMSRTGSEFEASTWVPPIGDGILVRFLFRGTGVTSHTYLVPRDTTSFEINFADVELPDPTDQTYTPATRTISWQEVGIGGDRVNLVFAGMLYGNVDWLTYGPRRSTGEVVFPDLGPGYPAPTSGTVFLILEAVPGGYASMRTDLGRRSVIGDPMVLPRATENHSTH